MKYKCKAIPMAKMIPTPQGFLPPLCNDCHTLDCENDIEIRQVSILGINVEAKLLAKRDDAYMVISCEGYISEKQTKNDS